VASRLTCVHQQTEGMVNTGLGVAAAANFETSKLREGMYRPCTCRTVFVAGLMEANPHRSAKSSGAMKSLSSHDAAPAAACACTEKAAAHTDRKTASRAHGMTRGTAAWGEHSNLWRYLRLDEVGDRHGKQFLVPCGRHDCGWTPLRPAGCRSFCSGKGSK